MSMIGKMVYFYTKDFQNNAVNHSLGGAWFNKGYGAGPFPALVVAEEINKPKNTLRLLVFIPCESSGVRQIPKRDVPYSRTAMDEHWTDEVPL